ncbi:MAG: hypothetical protein WCZ99_03750 [Candidatus Paceibacterota bacterium]
MIYHIFLFIFSFAILIFCARLVVNSLTFLAKLFKWREFVLVYFILVMAASIPNLSIGIFSVMEGVPELFFGDVLGNTLITLTLITGIAALTSKGLMADSRVIQKSSFFLIVSSALPLLLIMDGELGRGDGVVLLLMFFLYSSWLFSKRKLFKHEYDGKENVKHPVSLLFKSVGGIFLGIPLLIFAGDLIVKSSVFFTNYFDIQIAIFGVFIVALGTSLPELFFIITAAKRQNDWLALGGIIGDVIVLSTFGLGFIVVISPIKIVLFSSFIPIFIFLVIASFLFFFFIKSEKRIDSKEAVALLFVYFAFILSKIISYFLG